MMGNYDGLWWIIIGHRDGCRQQRWRHSTHGPEMLSALPIAAMIALSASLVARGNRSDRSTCRTCEYSARLSVLLQLSGPAWAGGVAVPDSLDRARTIDASPEWTPPYSMCSAIAYITCDRPHARFRPPVLEDAAYRSVLTSRALTALTHSLMPIR